MQLEKAFTFALKVLLQENLDNSKKSFEETKQGAEYFKKRQESAKKTRDKALKINENLNQLLALIDSSDVDKEIIFRDPEILAIEKETEELRKALDVYKIKMRLKAKEDVDKVKEYADDVENSVKMVKCPRTMN